MFDKKDFLSAGNRTCNIISVIIDYCTCIITITGEITRENIYIFRLTTVSDIDK